MLAANQACRLQKPQMVKVKFSIMLEVQQMSSDWESIVEEIVEKLLTLKALDLNDICEALSLTVEE